ncbi:MAG: zinc dependent phospholipase C family protein, partial [Candidatus Binataceae bacterium]
MIPAVAAVVCIAVVLLIPQPAFAWGPVTHIALGVQVLANVVAPDHPLRAALLGFPEVFLYGSLAPDIVQGRRLQSRLRRHSHNWATGTGLLKAAPGDEERAFAYGYLAHLAADVVAHNFFLPARFVGRFDAGVASHILAEARFDSFHDKGFRDLLANLMNSDFRELDSILKKAIDSPFIAFAAHRGIFGGALKRIRQFDSVVRSLGGPSESELRDVELFTAASTSAIAAMLSEPEHG